MKYNQLGKSGVKVSEVSYGSWVTFAKQIGRPEIKKLMHCAFDNGINFFDNAEAYASGGAESFMGEIIKDFRREDLVLSTKIFWGGEGPNDTGLSRKHLIEGCKGSLKRMQLEYVDLIFCHRPDPDTPIEETVLAMDYLVRQGFAFYWGTSEWPADLIESAYKTAEQLHCIPPTMEQPEYNMFHRARVEKEYHKLFKKYQMGTTTWSPLAYGILTGKYKDGIPEDSRLARESWLQPEDLERRVNITNLLSEVAAGIDCEVSQLAIAWCLKNANVSSVILGASSISQLEENLKATEVKERITDEMMSEIDKILAQ